MCLCTCLAHISGDTVPLRRMFLEIGMGCKLYDRKEHEHEKSLFLVCFSTVYMFPESIGERLETFARGLPYYLIKVQPFYKTSEIL